MRYLRKESGTYEKACEKRLNYITVASRRHLGTEGRRLLYMADTNESQVVIALRLFLEEYKWDTSLVPAPVHKKMEFETRTINKVEPSFNALEVFTNGKF